MHISKIKNIIAPARWASWMGQLEGADRDHINGAARRPNRKGSSLVLKNNLHICIRPCLFSKSEEEQVCVSSKNR